MGFSNAAECEDYGHEPDKYVGLLCCYEDGCNFNLTVPEPESLPQAAPKACQFNGSLIGIAAQSIGTGAGTPNYNNGTWYNMTTLQMKDYLGTPHMVPLEPNHFSCIDGRHDDEVLAHRPRQN